MSKNIAGLDRKRPQLNIVPDNLHLDPLNPRLPAETQEKDELDIIYCLYKFFDIDELALSIGENGYFDEEPLVAIPMGLPEKFKNLRADKLKKNKEYIDFISKPKTQFTVVEGNRRLATIKVLLSLELQTKFKIKTFPEISSEVIKDISELPVIVYPNRKEVLPYLGVRHITGIKKWDPYAKARYVAYMVQEGKTLKEIQQIVADRSNSARKFYLCYKLVEQVENEFGIDTSLARNEFSYLLLASGQGAIKDFLGIPSNLSEVNFDQPVPKEKTENLKLLFSWLYGEGTRTPRVLKESRDITNYLTHIIKSPIALEHLKANGKLLDAYDRSGGEENLLTTYLKRANDNLEKSLQFIHRHKKSESVQSEIDKCKETIQTIDKIIEN
ncbi:MAG: hypothetical protein HY840_13400 [Bacteroidetes bacterium]|nr:hypothetical protein [Bacteroidota bacterium]